MNDKAKIAALRAALEGMLEYTGSIDPSQGMDEFDCDAVKVAAKALALTADDAEQAPVLRRAFDPSPLDVYADAISTSGGEK